MPTMAASYKLWPAAHLVNFALVPPAYRVLYTNLVSVRIRPLKSRLCAALRPRCVRWRCTSLCPVAAPAVVVKPFPCCAHPSA